MAPSDPAEEVLAMQIRTLVDLAAVTRDARQRRGLTQAALAKQAGVSRAWIISLESGDAGRAEIGRVLAVLAALDLLPLTLPSSHSTPPPPFPPTSRTREEAAPLPGESGFDLAGHVASFITPRPSR